jgi:hypothetical protein
MQNVQQPISSNQRAEERSIPDSTFDVRRPMLDVSKAVRCLSWIKNFFDYLGASREAPPSGLPFLSSAWWPGLWWGLLAGLILLFCGQTSKFIYIDF